MKYPCLIEKRFCKTSVHIELEQEGLNKYGEPLESIIIDTVCNYQDSSKTVLTAEKKLVQINGVAFFSGDIAPNLSNIAAGTVIVNGVERYIYQGKKARNPDGTVNYTELILI